MADAPAQPSAEPKGEAQPTDTPTTEKPQGDAGAGDAGAGKPDPKDVESTWDDPNFRNHPRTKQLLSDSKELKELKRKQAEAEEKSLTEQNKHKEVAEKRKAKIAELEEKLNKQTINNALTTALAGSGVVDLDGALKLADRSGLEVGEDGTVSGVDKAVESLKKDRSYLFSTSTDGDSQAVGSPTNPSNGSGSQPGKTMKFKRSQLQDPKFYQDNRDEIIKAQKAGLIEDDLTS